MRYKFILVLLFLPSCTLTDIASSVLPVGNKPSIEANVALGKTNTQDKALASVKGEDNRQVADVISNTTNTSTKAEVVNNNNISMLFLLLLIMGWLLPTPTVMFKGIVSLFKGDKKET